MEQAFYNLSRLAKSMYSLALWVCVYMYIHKHMHMYICTSLPYVNSALCT